jgi:hypothetical protein
MTIALLGLAEAEELVFGILPHYFHRQSKGRMAGVSP